MSKRTWQHQCERCRAFYEARQRFPKYLRCPSCRREVRLAYLQEYADRERDELRFLRGFVGLAASAIVAGTWVEWSAPVDWQHYATKYGLKTVGVVDSVADKRQ